jgi:hypothetical protein
MVLNSYGASNLGADVTFTDLGGGPLDVTKNPNQQ